MAIKIRLAGGLGNQLFQLNTALNIKDSLKSKDKIIINLSYLNQYSAERKPLIANFFNFNYHANRVIFDKKPELIMDMRISKIFGLAIEKGLSLDYDSSIPLKTSQFFMGDIFLDGYYQNTRPFKVHPNLMSVKKNIARHAANILDKLNIGHDFYAMHIRRGDYVSEPSVTKVFNTIDMPFFSYIRSAHFNDNKPLLIFSDDTDTAKKYSSQLGGIHFVDKELDVLDEFSLMLMSSGIAISNSTFSWWASVLGGEKPDGIHSPRNWYRKRSLNRKNRLNEINIINSVDNKIC